jgi:hypothetical protein
LGSSEPLQKWQRRRQLTASTSASDPVEHFIVAARSPLFSVSTMEENKIGVALIIAWPTNFRSV